MGWSRPVLERFTVGLDIGGTKVVAGIVDAAGNVLDRRRGETPSKSPQATEDVIVELVAELGSRWDVASVGIGAAGFVDAGRSNVLFAPHLAWRREPLRDRVQQRLRLPVIVENDANAAAWAEWRFGTARGEDHLLCVNLGTGIGGAIVHGGVLYRGKYGVAGEFGHMIVVPDGHRCECGNRGCWEQYASGNALGREARELAAADSPVAQTLIARVGGDLSRITGPLIAEMAKDGDPAAIELFEDVGRWLGIGIANLCAAFDPGCVVVGGGVSEAGEYLLAPARVASRRNLTGRGYRPEARIERTALGNEAGLIGAADLARWEAQRLRRWSLGALRRGVTARRA
ncbi:MAG: ROK family glucokinase [Streptosporangiales bacterium]|nr:ROK family glucokinase [Streptosporangiales bacterium]